MASATSTVMQGPSVRSVARQIGMLGVLAVVVAVLTFLFNLVGTLCIAVVAGMMAGASRRFNWQVVGVSLVPPAVAVALGWATKSELDLRRYVSLSGVCLGSFWLTWLATSLLMSLEKKSAQTSGRRTSTSSTSSQVPNTALDCNDNPPVNAAVKTVQPKGHLNLSHLQGTWHCETRHQDGESNKRVLIVKQGRFSLSIVDASGAARELGQGDVTVDSSHGRTNLTISGSSGLEGADI